MISAFRAGVALIALPALAGAGELRLATFDADITPPVGSMMAYDPVARVGEMSLRGRGVALLGAGKPIVLCALDWIGLFNEAHDLFRAELARAAGTDADRVAVQCVHQHDAPRMDTATEEILRAAGQPPGAWDSASTRPAMRRVAEALRASLANARPVTHVGWGSAKVEQVASNRRLPGPDGRLLVRYTTEKDPARRAMPEGLIDPAVDVVSLWNGDVPLAALSYYACHPQSYYRTGVPSPDFPGIARFFRGQDEPRALHVHFCGAGGNVGAGKYNDGSPENRLVLARRLADGMKRAFDATVKTPLAAGEVGWMVEEVRLPVAEYLDERDMARRIETGKAAAGSAIPAGPEDALRLAFLRRAAAGRTTAIPCLRLGRIRVLHMPGELFVEYQIASKAMCPDGQVALAAYGDSGPMYIGTKKAYGETGGYETEPRSSNVSPDVEDVLMTAMRKLVGSGPAP